MFPRRRRLCVGPVAQGVEYLDKMPGSTLIQHANIFARTPLRDAVISSLLAVDEGTFSRDLAFSALTELGARMYDPETNELSVPSSFGWA